MVAMEHLSRRADATGGNRLLNPVAASLHVLRTDNAPRVRVGYIGLSTRGHARTLATQIEGLIYLREVTMSASKATQKKSAKSTTATKGFTAEERAAMKARARELQAGEPSAQVRVRTGRTRRARRT